MRAMLPTLVASAGYVVFALILLASILGTGVVIERCWRLLPLRRVLAQTRNRCEGVLHEDGARASAAHKSLGVADDAMARTLRRGLEERRGGVDAVRAAALEAAQRELPALERNLGVLATVAQVAPLLGLFGTVAGLMEAFQAASHAEQVTPGLLASGIYKALGTTAAGLAVAIPAWIAYNGLSGVVARLADELEHGAFELARLVGIAQRAADKQRRRSLVAPADAGPSASPTEG
jgi:biopolymer transport protein ExbB